MAFDWFRYRVIHKKLSQKTEDKMQEKMQMILQVNETWHTYNNNIVNLFAKKLIQNPHFYSRYGTFYV